MWGPAHGPQFHSRLQASLDSDTHDVLLCEAALQDGALDSYERLRELQEERYDEYAHRELAVGECFKLSGDVFVAMREFGR